MGHRPPGHSCQVFAADALFATAGANLGDALDQPDAVCLGDVYRLDPDAAPLRLSLTAPGAGAGQTLAEGTQVGRPGDQIRPIARYTMLAPDGDRVELLLLGLGDPGPLLVLPLSPVTPRRDYTLVQIDPAPAEVRLADLVCVSFTRGTQITLATGEQRAIETLRPDMRILTRDSGPQPVRWIGRATLRAHGAYAPVVITKGTLGNAGDLIVSQHHRVFLYQRDRHHGLPTAEILVQAKHLVDGDRVFRREGGFVDYFSLVFDRHEIIYAEGIPAESLMVNEATVSRLPPELAADVSARFPGLSQSQHFGTEAGREALARLALGPGARAR